MATKKSISIWTLFCTLIVAGLLGFTLATGPGTATAQQAAPTENKGVTSTPPLTAVDLGFQISAMQGHQLRLRIVTVDPSGVIGLHSHKDRLGVVYVLKGTLTEHQGDVAKDYGAGDSFPDSVTHWLENKGTSPVELIVVDIFKQP